MSEAEQNPYTMGRFWQAYAELYWPELDNNEGLASFAKQIAANLPASGTEGPIRILALGFGFGGVELPIIYNLKKHTKRPIEIVAIDSAAEPMVFASRLLADGILALPPDISALRQRFTNQFPQQETVIPENFKNPSHPNLPSGDRLTLVQDDLDLEKATEETLYPEISNWHKRLLENLDIGPDKRFDIVFASFSLFHLAFWRAALFQSLELLRSNGLFIHGLVEGDEALFEGRPGRESSHHYLASQVFGEIVFKSAGGKKIINEARGASASRPYVITEFIKRLEPFGFNPLAPLYSEKPEYKYRVTQEVQGESYLALLETKGFSTFHNIAKRGGTADDYKALCSKVAAFLNASEIKSDLLEIDFVWTIHKVESELLKKFPLYTRFSRTKDHLPDDPIQREFIKTYRTEYELNTALSINPHGADDELIADMGQKLVKQGTLHDKCLALEFGVYSHKSERLKWSVVVKMYDADRERQLRQLREVVLYLKLLRTRSIEDNYSNTKVLLDTVLGYFSKPCIFTYQIQGGKYTVNHYTHRDFEEIRFVLACPSETVSAEIMSLRSKLSNCFSVNNKVNCDNKSIVKYAENYDIEAACFKQIYDFFNVGEYEAIAEESLKSSVKDMTGLDVSLRKKIGDLVTKQMVLTIRYLEILSDIKHVVFYPATYEVKGQTSGREMVIGLYSEIIGQTVLKDEFYKFQQIFNVIRFQRQQKEVKIQTSGDIFHRLPSTLATIRKELLRDNPDIKIPISFDATAYWCAIAKHQSGSALEVPGFLEIENSLNNKGTTFTVDAILKLANDIALPIAESRVTQGPTKLMRDIQPAIEITHKSEFHTESLKESRLVIGALLIMLIEATQHTYLCSSTGNIIIEISNGSIVVTNPSINSCHIPDNGISRQLKELFELNKMLNELQPNYYDIKPASPSNTVARYWTASINYKR